MMKKILFFIGKGGVGKTTLSALSALYYASRGESVRLISLDPAHNLSDIFKKKLGERERSIYKNLSAQEIDNTKRIKTYLKEVQNDIKAAYSYQSAFNLQGHFDIIKYSPGLEEHALLRAFKERLDKSDNIDYLIFDMPPTALTIKFFRLPSLSLIWLNKLLDLRKKIIEKKEIITRIKFGTKEFEGDKVIRKIELLIKEYSFLQEIFQDQGKAAPYLVVNPDELSIRESEKIIKDMKETGISPAGIIMNKGKGDGFEVSLTHAFSGQDRITVPLAQRPPVGLSHLEDFLHENESAFRLLVSG